MDSSDRIRRIRGFVGYVDSSDTWIRRIRGFVGYVDSSDTWIRRIRGFVGYVDSSVKPDKTGAGELEMSKLDKPEFVHLI